MIIGIDASRANRAHKSGTEWYSYYAIRALAKLDDHNEYILYTDTPLSGGLVDLRDSEENTSVKYKDGFQILKSPHNNFKAKVLKWPWKFFWSQGRLSLEMLFNAPDLLFVPAHALPIFHPRKSVVTIHDIGFRREGALYERTQIGAEKQRRQGVINALVRIISAGKYGANSFDYLDWSTSFALRKARAIIAISAFTKRELMEIYSNDGKNISVIHNSYNDKLYCAKAKDPISTEVLVKYGLQEPYIFYVGRLEKKKNIATLVEAFYFLKTQHPELPHKLYLIGDASFGFDDIKYSIHGFRLENEIKTTGWVAENDLPYIYSKADAFVFPSSYEGFGIPLLQAMACETPIVASNAASIPEIAGDAALLFDPTDPKDMAAKIYELLSDKALRSSLVANGQERVKQFNSAIWARQILDLFENVK